MVEVTVLSYGLYFEIARQNLGKAAEIKHQINQRESKSIGLLSGKIHDTDMPYLFRESLQVRHFATVSVIFSALTAEAFINHYGITKTSKNYFNYLDKLNLVDKWIIVPKVVTGNSIESGSHSIQRLQDLVKLRNKLVHYKTRKVSIKTIDDWERLGMASLGDAQNGIEAIRLLVKALNKLDESVNQEWLDDGSNPFMF